MQFFIGMVPPDEYKNKIMQFQNQWANNFLIDVVEPHITVKAQGGLTSDKDWLGKVYSICESFPSFEIVLNKPAFFGDSVLFLTVDSDKIYDLHKKIIEAVSPTEEIIKQYLELGDYTAHLTLGQTYFGLTSEELKDMAYRAEKELIPYPTFEANFLRVYQEIEANKYFKYIDIPLK